VIDVAGNPRRANGSLRNKYRARLRAIGGECGICHGKLGPIHYDEPSDSKHPLSFVIDEIKPVSRWREFGYSSPRAAAEDWNNLQAAHYICNAAKSNKVNFVIGASVPATQKGKENVMDGDW
jgi:5-methylcytosine-specific restriction endonuclease McrA